MQLDNQSHDLVTSTKTTKIIIQEVKKLLADFSLEI